MCYTGAICMKGDKPLKQKHVSSKLLCPLLALLLIFQMAVPVAAKDFPKSWPTPPEIASETGILMEASTGQILFDKGMDEIRYPASTTKVMTALLILENIKDLNEIITFTDVIIPDLEPGNSTIDAKVGEQLTVEQCLYAIMLASANEVCTQMAVRVAGTVSNFTAMMNKRAAELGCENTHFVNANGLPDPNHYTTAHDLARILAAAVANEDFCKISGAAKYTIPATNKTASPRNMTNTNALIAEGDSHYEGVLAGKTGHTEAARNTLVTAARRDNMTLICVVLRSEGKERFIDTTALFDYGFDQFHMDPVYWMNEETPAGYAVLPNNVTPGCMAITEEDSADMRTRTYSYQGAEILKVHAALPMEVKTRTTSDMSMFKTGMSEIQMGASFVFPVMMVLLAVLVIVLTVVIVKAVLNSKRPKKKRKNRV